MSSLSTCHTDAMTGVAQNKAITLEVLLHSIKCHDDTINVIIELYLKVDEYTKYLVWPL